MVSYLHELVVSVRSLDDKSVTGTLTENKDFKVTLDYFNKHKWPATAESILTITELVIPPRSEIVIFFGMKKTLLQFEKYPNDPARGFNIMSMPVLY